MPNLNNVLQIVGNVGANQKDTNSPVRSAFMQDGTPVHNFSVAVNKTTGKDTQGQKLTKTTWFDVSCWGGKDYDKWTAVIGFLASGKQVLVRGEVDVRQWTDNQGNARASLTLRADDILLLGSKEESRPQAAAEDDVEF